MPSRSARFAQRAGVPALVLAMAAGGAALAWLALAGHPAPLGGVRLPLLLLGALFALFETVVLTLQVSKDMTNAQKVTFTEIPLALGLLFAAPSELLLAGVAVPALMVMRQNAPPLKKAFNAVNRLVEVTVALAAHRALVDPDDPFSVRGWVALLVALALSGVVSGLCVTAAISVSTGEIPREDLGELILSAAPLNAVTGTIGFVAAITMEAGAHAVGPLIALLGIVLVSLRAFSRLTERHMDLVTLHGWGQKVGAARGVDPVLMGVLDGAPDMLTAGRAEAFLRDGDASTRISRNADGSLSRVPVPEADVPAQAGVTGGKAAVVASAPIGDGKEIVLRVSERPAAQRSFGGEDVRMLDMVAQQTAMALRGALLIDKLRHDALHDALTGLPNRQALTDELRWRLGEDGDTSVLWMGLHDLAAVNEALGYDLGDELLVQVSRRVAEAAPEGSFVSRVGGEEFAIILPEDEARTVWEQAEVLSGCLNALFTLSDAPIAVRGSVGVATASAGTSGDGAEVLLQHADIAMRACRTRGAGILAYVPEMDAATTDRLALVADLQAGIGRGELALFAQPKIRLSDGMPVGVEALVRWNHPERGLVSPGVFVPLAEQTGLDEPMTDWVLDEAVRHAAAWIGQGRDITVAVNVPARSLADFRLADAVAAALDRYSVPGAALVIEITESGLLDNPKVAAEALGRLSALGCKISVDDFGTGFSSLSHLKNLPVDEIKVDQTFVFGMLENKGDSAIVRSVIDLARNLGMRCVAEGIESEEVYAELRMLKCDVAQGYWMSRPMPIDEIPAWLDERAKTQVAALAPRPSGD